MHLRPFYITASLLLAGSLLSAQEQRVSTAVEGEKRMVEILHSDRLSRAAGRTPGMKKLIGEVRLKHKEVLMDCDSAYFYESENLVHAFSNIHLRQGDSLHLYGDRLKYYGNRDLAEVRENVELIDNESHLYTQYLDYELNTETGYYYNGGRILNGDNSLESVSGIYYSGLKMAEFEDSVVLTNPDYTVWSDTLRYETVDEIAHFHGPTRMVGDSSDMYCERGTYDTQQKRSWLRQNAFIRSKSQSIRGDALYYDDFAGRGESMARVQIIDTTDNMIVEGNKAWYTKNPEWFLVTDSSLFMQVSGTDTLFLHADTLQAESIPDTTGAYRFFNAYKGVRVFKDDFQASCDSLTYSLKDSVIRLYISPVLWTGPHQVTGDSIALFTRNRQLEHMELYRTAMIISEEDSLRYNQVRGRDLQGWFRDGELYRVDVTGNTENIYYVKEENKMVGVNRSTSKELILYMKEGRLHRINMINTVEGVMDPPQKKSPLEQRLDQFIWLGQLRPSSRWDVFPNYKAKKRPWRGSR